MKNYCVPVIIIFLFFLTTRNLSAQNGLTRSDALLIQPESNCSFSNYTTQGSEMWFKFIAQNEKISIEVVSDKYGLNLAHIHNVKIYKGNNVDETEYEELPYNPESKKLRINLNAGDLQISETYYVKVDRLPKYDHCNKSSCIANSSTNPAQFKICIKNVPTFIEGTEKVL